MAFWSDNASGVAPEILEALTGAAAGTVPSYGDDPISKGLDGAFSDVFERRVTVFPVATGTAANALSMALLSPPYGAVFCHDEAHLHVDECGAPEFFAAGAKLVPVPGQHGRIDPIALQSKIDSFPRGFVHSVQPAVLTVSQSTECGTVYPREALTSLVRVARKAGLAVHMDGARFANAVAALGCPPADLTWRAGVDILSFGATKTGAMAAEAVVLFDPAHAERLGYLRKRAGHLVSKMRFVSAQLHAYLAGDLWLRLAGQANAMARRLADGLAAFGVRLAFPVEANEVFPILPNDVIEDLERAGFGFYRWPSADRDGGSAIRLVTSFATDPGDVDRFLACVGRGHAAARGPRDTRRTRPVSG